MAKKSKPLGIETIEVLEAIISIEREYGHNGIEFLGSLYMSGTVNLIMEISPDEKSAQKNAKMFSDMILMAMEKMSNDGIFERERPLQ
jgi:hypothetical protein